MIGRAPPGSRSGGELRRYCFDLALRVLERRGFSPLTRPTMLRIGFRDICRDLDLHESTVVRIVTGPGEVTRVHLDYDANALVFRPAGALPTPGWVEQAIREAFPKLRVHTGDSTDPNGAGGVRGPFRRSRDLRRVASEPAGHAARTRPADPPLRARAVPVGQRPGGRPSANAPPLGQNRLARQRDWRGRGSAGGKIPGWR